MIEYEQIFQRLVAFVGKNAKVIDEVTVAIECVWRDAICVQASSAPARRQRHEHEWTR